MREEREHSFLVVFGIRGRRDLSLVWYYGMAMLTERKWEILGCSLLPHFVQQKPTNCKQ
ncbi:hypothetical protein PanWU01x14_154930 [Parasponia andersonii]|uniref:Uncharacterized protein n=1 Tax=Parasponia andersonii TaxID=3476 RepID=A0A2P5CGL1_PARAD|nr:hypothetical protein PanWU01x14_154930 [Parasponia andersonii]